MDRSSLVLGLLAASLAVSGNVYTGSGPVFRRLDTASDNEAMTDDEPYFIVGRGTFNSSYATSVKISAAFKDFAFLPSPPFTVADPTALWYNIRSVTSKKSNGWEVETSLKRPCSATITTTPSSLDFSFMAIRPGWYNYLSSNVSFIANRTAVSHNGAQSTIYFSSAWHAGAIFNEPPVVIAQVQSTKDTDSFLNVRIHDVDVDRMTVSLISTEDHVGSGGDEVVGWAAFQATNFSMPTGMMSAFTVPPPTSSDRIYNIDPKLVIPQQCGDQIVLASSNGGGSVSKSALTMIKSISADGTSEAYVGTFSCATYNGDKSANTGSLGVVVYQFGMCSQFSPSSQKLTPIDSKTSSTPKTTDTYITNTIVWMIVGTLCSILFLIGACVLYSRWKKSREVKEQAVPQRPVYGDPYYNGAGAGAGPGPGPGPSGGRRPF
eukprot:Lankesteria_metandrocarpae@DN868_c0_g1_i2.p1